MRWGEDNFQSGEIHTQDTVGMEHPLPDVLLMAMLNNVLRTKTLIPLIGFSPQK